MTGQLIGKIMYIQIHTCLMKLAALLNVKVTGKLELGEEVT